MKHLFTYLLLFFCQWSAWAQKGNYVENHVPIAQEIMQEYHIPASLILAIAIHESAAGQSKIARNQHNHFGIKGKNEVKGIRSAYKSYPSSKESYAHFAELIAHKPYFASLQNKPVEKWVHKIHHGYARSPTWAAQVISIIKKYGLKQYDEDFSPKEKNQKESIDKELVIEQNEVHTVKKGETLSSIAKKYHTNVNAIKEKNHLNSSKISIGQRIQI